MTNMNLLVRKIFYSRNGKSYFSKLITRSLWQIENNKASPDEGGLDILLVKT